MATFVLDNPLSTVALTNQQIAPQCENSPASSAALTRPHKHTFRFPTYGNNFRVIVIAAPASVRSASLPDWVNPTIAAYAGIQSLPGNWDSYGGKVINRELINQSLMILSKVMQSNSTAPSIVPLGDGGLQIEWHRKQQDLEIMFSAEETPQFFYRNRATGETDEGPARETAKLIDFIKNLL